MTKLCICQICSCGRHHCPHRPKQTFGQGSKPCMLTEYAQKYIEKPLEMRSSFKPDHQPLKTGDPLENQTTNRVDFIPHPLERPYQRIGDTYRKPEGHMDNVTSYTKDYIPKHGERAQLAKRDYSRKVDGEFKGEPTYKADYRKWDLQGREHFGPAQMYVPNKDAFNGQSSYTHDYDGKKGARQRSFKPVDVAMSSSQPMDDRTGYREYYVKHPIEPRHFKEAEKYMGPKAPLEGLTTSKRDYTEKPFGFRQSFKPENDGFSSGAPFNGDTTHNNDYKTWQLEKPFVHQQEVYVPPAGTMEKDSTSHLAFKKLPLPKMEQRRPISARKELGQFEGNTTHKSDYQKWNTARTLPTIRQETHITSHPFEGTSTYVSHFGPKHGDPTMSFKPHSMGFASDARFDDNTMYRTEFTRKQTICPAAILDTGTSRYAYIEQDTQGHKFYQPVRSSDTVYDISGQKIQLPVS